MAKKKTAQVDRRLPQRYHKLVVTNLVAKMELPIPVDEDKVRQLFGAVSKRYPRMVRTRLPKREAQETGTYELHEPDKADLKRPLRSLVVSPTILAVAASYPLTFSEQMKAIRFLAGAIDRLSIINPHFIDYVDFKLAFEAKHQGNHHAAVLGSTFKDSSFQKAVEKIGGVPARFVPEIQILLPKDPSYRYYLELRPRTSLTEIESGRFDGDHIAAICGILRTRDFGPRDSLASLTTKMTDLLLPVVRSSFLPIVLKPLLASLKD